MTVLLIFAPLLLAWALLHRASRQREWGFVGFPLSGAAIMLRKFNQDMARRRLRLVDTFTPAMQDLGHAFEKMQAVLRESGMFTEQEIRKELSYD